MRTKATLNFLTFEPSNYFGSLLRYYVASEVEAFGSLLPGRSYSSNTYKYGFNGKEKDDEVKGSGCQYDYGMRIYDSRIARFLSVDPLTKSYPDLTPYQFATNQPIWAIDLDGEERKIVVHRWQASTASWTTKTVYWREVFPDEDYGPKGTGSMHHWFGSETETNPGEGSYHDDGPTKFSIWMRKMSTGVIIWGSNTFDEEIAADKTRVKPNNIISVDFHALKKIFALIDVAMPKDFKPKPEGPTSDQVPEQKIADALEKGLKTTKEAKEIKGDSPGYIINDSKDSSTYYYPIKGNKYGKQTIGEMRKDKLVKGKDATVVDKLPGGVQVEQ